MYSNVYAINVVGRGSNKEIIKDIDEALEKEENEIWYQAPFLLKDVKKDDKGRPFIISDHSGRDQKYYLKHYPRKRLLAMHDFTPEEKKIREEIKETKDPAFKVIL